jgi:hypothetical protein
MAGFLLVLAVFGLGAPDEDAAASPQAFIEQMAESVRAGDLLSVYDRLTPAGQERLAKIVARAAPAVGLDPAKAGTRDIVAALEKMLKTEGNAQLPVLAQLKVTVVKVDRPDENTARVGVRGALLGREEFAIVTLKQAGGQWKADAVGPPPGARRKANEAAAIATLRNLTSAQAQFQAVAAADVNQNGVGEYGFFGELSGAVGVRGGRKLDPPVLSTFFQGVKDGTITRGGYHFRIFLADAKGGGVRRYEDVKNVDAEKAESVWCCYAWPEKYGETGTRTFFVNQWGDVLATDHAGYTGAKGPAALAAFKGDGDKSPTLASDAALNAKGHDGHDWKPVG